MSTLRCEACETGVVLFTFLLNSMSANTFSHAPVVYTRKQVLVLSQVRLILGKRPEIPTKLQRERTGSSAGVKRRK